MAACGDATESSLLRSDIAIIMGGEPTFVPLKPEGAEWATAAFGPTKLAYAHRLARQLIADTYPGAVILETSGKHYPGEPIPRWTLLQRRLDGEPIWQDPSRLRSSLEPGQHKLADARRVAQKLARTLGLSHLD
ncbi:MAG: transglutaminase family protein [Candidatus Synoicihabitans palmerolidicus]|nr:transglutaminase family protein [Candidatus Synoicihabitans palmerolidicus]